MCASVSLFSKTYTRRLAQKRVQVENKNKTRSTTTNKHPSRFPAHSQIYFRYNCSNSDWFCFCYENSRGDWSSNSLSCSSSEEEDLAQKPEETIDQNRGSFQQIVASTFFSETFFKQRTKIATFSGDYSRNRYKMNALSDYMQKFGIKDSAELKVGQSFFNTPNAPSYHTMRYDFIPASVDSTMASALEVGQKGKVTVTMPNESKNGEANSESIFSGSRKSQAKECILIINHETGELTLERLNTAMIVKNQRVSKEDYTGVSFALNKKLQQQQPHHLSGHSSHASSSSTSVSNRSPNIRLPTLVSGGKSKTSPPLSLPSKPLQPPSNNRPFVLPTLASKNSASVVSPTGENSFTSGAKSAFGGVSLAAISAAKGAQELSDSSSDSSDDENASSSSDSSSSDDEKGFSSSKKTSMPTVSGGFGGGTGGGASSMPSMPMFGKSMPSLMGKPKQVSPVNTSNHSTASMHSNSSTIASKPSRVLSLSESDSDSDDDMGPAPKPTKSTWGQQQQVNAKPSAMPSMPSMPSMPVSFGGLSKPAPLPPAPVANVDSVLNNDLQLSESSSDEDDD